MLRFASLSTRLTRSAFQTARPSCRPWTPHARGLAQAVFERNKPHLNVGTIGHVDHGKVCKHTS